MRQKWDFLPASSPLSLSSSLHFRLVIVLGGGECGACGACGGGAAGRERRAAGDRGRVRVRPSVGHQKPSLSPFFAEILPDINAPSSSSSLVAAGFLVLCYDQPILFSVLF